MITSERGSIETERELANGVFIWLQQTRDTLPPPLNERASQFAEEFLLVHEDFVQLRLLIGEMEDAYVLPVRLHIAGFDEWVVRELDDGSFGEARETFTQRLTELFPVEAAHPELIDSVSVTEEQTTSTVSVELEQPEQQRQRNKELGAQVARTASKQRELPLLTNEAVGLLRRAHSDTDELGWQEKALCAQTDPESFFPEKGGSTREAKKVCQSCEVREECLDAALANDERFGIWGGLSERERRKLKKRRA